MNKIIYEPRLIKSLIITDTCKDYLDCKTTLGLKKPLNEDFAATITSPQNEKITLLAVCDGVGGAESGDLASEYTIKHLVHWFNNYEFEPENNLDKDFIREIKRINHHLKRKYKEAETTISAALIDEKDTHILNIGDSRTYAINGNILTQITKDDLEVWHFLYRNGKGKYTKDELRFIIFNHILTKALGSGFFPRLKTNIIENDSYDGLLLLTDGVTDIVSDKRINELLKEEDYENFLTNLLNEACYCESETYQGDRKPKWLFRPTIPGKDNATGAVYIKRS